MQEPLATQARPSRAQIEPAALELLSRHSAGLLATARRYSATPEDAEDAYQRGVEILLTKAPTTSEADLLPWLKTVVKHEAFAVSKSSGRLVPAEDPLGQAQDTGAWTHERAERYERLRIGAEAMAGLKPHEIRCLLLKAEGLSYQEICEATGFTYTKVNRCLTEGRRAFMQRVAGIEAGAECERLEPLISKVADGEASAEEMQVVRPHLKSCLACKATLREYRATPARVAGLVPPVVALAGGGGGASGFLGRLVERFAGMGDAAGAKVAAVAASAVVLAGGGAAGVGAIHHDAPQLDPSAFASPPSASASSSASASAFVPASSPASMPPSAPTSAPAPSTVITTAIPDPPPSPPAHESRDRDPQPEFGPGVATDPSPAGYTGSEPAPATGSAPRSASTTAPGGSTRSAPPASKPAASAPREFGP